MLFRWDWDTSNILWIHWKSEKKKQKMSNKLEGNWSLMGLEKIIPYAQMAK